MCVARQDAALNQNKVLRRPHRRWSILVTSSYTPFPGQKRLFLLQFVGVDLPADWVASFERGLDLPKVLFPPIARPAKSVGRAVPYFCDACRRLG